MADRAAFTTFDINLEAGAAKSPSQPSASSPFRMLVLGDFSGRANRGVNDAANLATRKLVTVDRDNFDDVLERLQPSLQLRLGSQDAAVTTITPSDASTATAISRRSRGGFQSLPRFEPRRWLIGSRTYR